MKLLLDHNLSPKLAKKLGESFGSIDHVDRLGMSEMVDVGLWDYAKENGYTIVTKDKDFYERSALIGGLPKIIHLTLGNSSVNETAKVILDKKGHVLDFLNHPSKTYLSLP